MSQTASDSALNAFIGSSIGNYRVCRIARLSATGPVLVAKHVGTGMDVEIKVLKNEAASDEQLARRMKREVVALKQLAHRNIIRIWATGRDGDKRYLVMEHVPGRTLASWLDEVGTFAVEDALHMAAEILTGLAAAHRAGVVHRDISPGRILVGESGRVVIADFGLSRTARSAASASASFDTQEMTAMAYLAPEQLEQKASVQSDLYSVGCVLYRCISGAVPFDGDPVEQVMARLQIPAIPLSERDPAVNPFAARLVMRFLERDPAKRWVDAGSALRDVRAML